MKYALLFLFSFLSLSVFSSTINVKNIDELNKANAQARPGDVVILKNGEWHDVSLMLTCVGTKDQPITFKAQTAGKVFITGKSKLNFGGNYIIVDGLYFTKGYAGEDVIKFCIDDKHIATNCRVTNTVIDDFNNLQKLKANYWVAFYGKQNRIDHCTFYNKKNLGVLVAVMLEGKVNQDNSHQIDHNYFGSRVPLASNAGEIIRIGVAETCEFNSNTQITDNFFENCNGEAEIISIKSCHNIIRSNLFKECQGSVVFRHGNFNTVENNLFLGNGIENTGGVRLINKGQLVVNNFFYKCRGVGFRSPLTLMNGVPNSPAIRYVAVSNAVITNNTFFDCTPISFCEGSDAERSEVPSNVQFVNNVFYNAVDTLLYYAFDRIRGIKFTNNLVSSAINQSLANGFIKTNLRPLAKSRFSIYAPNSVSGTLLSDSTRKAGSQRLQFGFSPTAGYAAINRLKAIETNAYTVCGVRWFIPKNTILYQKIIAVSCKSATELTEEIAKNKDSRLQINLTGTDYTFTSPLLIDHDVILSSSRKTPVRFLLKGLPTNYCIQIKAGKSLTLKNLAVEFVSETPKTFIRSDTSGNCNHSNLSILNCAISNMNGDFIVAEKSSLFDSVAVSDCHFKNMNGVIFNFKKEIDKLGYYNVEKLKIDNTTFDNCRGQIIGIIRSGKDESTLGPWLLFTHNTLVNCVTENEEPLLFVSGINRSFIDKNNFTHCNVNKKLFSFDDTVKAVHIFSNNTLTQSGFVIMDKYVISVKNSIQ